jgi:HEAT repeat protein
MERWWPFRPSVPEEPLQLAADPAAWSLGDEAQRAQLLPLLLQELSSPAPSRRERAIELLAEAGAQESIPAFLAVLRREEHLMVRWRALHALQQLSGALAESEGPPAGEIEAWREGVVTELITQLHSEHASQRWEAAEGLGRLGDPRAVPALVEMLRDPHAFVRWAAAQALGQIGGETAIPLLLTLVQDPDRLARRSAVDALGHLDAEPARRALHRALHDPDPTVCRNAIEAVARQGDAGAVEALASLLDVRNDPWVRYSAAEALGVVGDHRAVAPLIEAVQDSRVLIRRVAVRALGLLRDSRAIQPLIQALKDPDPEVRLHAVDGLGRIGHEGVIPYLKPLVHDAASVFGRQVGESAQQSVVTIQERTARQG